MKQNIKPGMYRHYKGGIYEVISVARHSETLEDMVVYKSTSDGGYWVRPAGMWNEKVSVEDSTVLRFTHMEEKSED